MDEPSDLDALVAAAVRREISRVTRRYVPLLVAAVVFALIVALVPTVGSKDSASNDNVAAGPGNAAATDGTVGGASAGPAGGAAAAGEPTDVPGAPAAGGGATGAGAGPSTAGAPGGGAGGDAGSTAVAAVSTQGAARSGVECGKGAPQVTWTKYAPPCVATFDGGNGGATSRGVTKDTITVTFRRAQSTQDTAVYAAAGDAAPAPDPQFIADIRTYVDYFNKQYELFGRKVVVKDFQGQGDYIQEDQGQGQAAAAADGATAAQLGGFADITFPLKASRPYWESLARNKVIAIGPLGFPDSWYQRYAPYWYSVAATGSMGARLVANLVCHRLNTLPAIFAGDPLYQRTKRVFGLVTPENPEYLGVANEIMAGMKTCGATVARRASYAINVATFQTQATSIAAQMKAAGVTSALCFCDPLVPIFLSNAAQSQNWQPEWFEPYYNDPQGRLMNQSQWAHALTGGATHPVLKDTEAYHVWKLASPNAEPREQYFDTAYYTVLFLFNALQAAGPQLTPQSVAAGLARLPATSRGDIGAWTYGAGKYSPVSEVPIAKWNPNATSKRDNKQGAWISCDGGAWYPYNDASKWPPLAQPQC
jgi:hypothetical protein